MIATLHRPERRELRSADRVVLGAMLAVFLGCVVVALLGRLAAAADLPRFEANSVVGPVELHVSPRRVPRTVSALAESTTWAGGTGGGLVITPVEDTALTVVSVRSDDGEAARLAADTAAAGLAHSLTTDGFGVGTFTVLAPAELSRPTAPSLLRHLAMGVLAGLCFAAAIPGLRAAVRGVGW